MKTKITLIVLLLSGAVITFSSCKKSGSKPTLDAKTVSGQIALNLAQTLYGGLGGFDISNGLTTGASLNRKQLLAKRQQMIQKLTGGKQVNDFGSDIGCGLSADTTVNYSDTENGTSVTIAGSIGYLFLCTSDVFSGFNIHDNLTITEKNASLSGTYKLAENLTIQAENPNDANTSITLGGTLSLTDNLSYVSPKSTTSESYSYNFTNPLVIDSSGTIASGSCSFTTSGSNASGTWNYTGTVTFLGGYNVKITINGTSYNANLQTGVVS
ncbi:MAG TPA: hypothetical protein VG367_10260 [Mucilaginibacter sp.]|jgi:hypothetical protein|nr:hypothetical protein [Mucilaginibacter sp.]